MNGRTNERKQGSRQRMALPRAHARFVRTAKQRSTRSTVSFGCRGSEGVHDGALSIGGSRSSVESAAALAPSAGLAPMSSRYPTRTRVSLNASSELDRTELGLAIDAVPGPVNTVIDTYMDDGVAAAAAELGCSGSSLKKITSAT